MKTLKFSLFILFVFFVMSHASAQADAPEFMTSRDRLSGLLSNINLKNDRNAAVTVYGLYVRQYASVLPGQSCDAASIIYPGTNNVAAGAFVSPLAIHASRKALIGSNYLYNMIYQAIYYANRIRPSSPPGCALPGCTWGTDSTQYHWCIYLGALAPVVTSAQYTANVPPATEVASSAGNYQYDLISNYVMLGPIVCNDQNHTCATTSQQTQAFS